MKTAGVVVVLALLTACTSQAGVSSTTGQRPLPTTTTTEVSPSTTPALTTTSTQPTHDVGLFRVDPATLAPVPGIEPLTTGDWISGYLSPDGDWLALHVGVEPDTNLIRVIETATGEIVTELPGQLADFIGVTGDGTIYSISYFQYQGPRLRKVAPGSTRFETVFDDFPSEFAYWESVAFLDPQRIAWFGRFGGDLEAPVAGVVILDLTSGEATTHMVEGMTIGDVEVTNVGDWSVSETVQPVVVWDSPRDRAIFVHGDADAVTILDLGTGEVSRHDWSTPTSWLDRLFAWLIPPAHAKGPSSYGVVRHAALGPSGEWLYVATSVSELVIESEESWFIESAPVGLAVIDTTTWELAHSLDIPVSEVFLSPDGGHLVAKGTTWTDSLSTSDVRSEGVFVIDTVSNEVVGRFDASYPWPDIQFSPDGGLLYLADTRFNIVDLSTMKVVGTQIWRDQEQLFGQALLLSTPQP